MGRVRGDTIDPRAAASMQARRRRKPAQGRPDEYDDDIAPPESVKKHTRDKQVKDARVGVTSKPLKTKEDVEKFKQLLRRGIERGIDTGAVKQYSDIKFNFTDPKKKKAAREVMKEVKEYDRMLVEAEEARERQMTKEFEKDTGMRMKKRPAKRKPKQMYDLHTGKPVKRKK